MKIGLRRGFDDASGGALAAGVGGELATGASGALDGEALPHGITVSVRLSTSLDVALARGAGRATFTGRRAVVVAEGAGAALDSTEAGANAGNGAAVDANSRASVSVERARVTVQNPIDMAPKSRTAAQPSSQRALVVGGIGGGRIVGIGVEDTDRETSTGGALGAGGMSATTLPTSG